MLSIFSTLCWSSVCLLQRNVCLGLPLIFLILLFGFLVLSYMSCLYILEINPLSVVLFAINFSHSKGCLLSLFIASFAVQRLLSLIKPHLFTFVFISITLGGGSKRILLQNMSECTAYVFL